MSDITVGSQVYINPYHEVAAFWQCIGRVETIKAATRQATVRWHNGQRGLGFGNMPVSTHPVENLVLEGQWPIEESK